MARNITKSFVLSAVLMALLAPSQAVFAAPSAPVAVLADESRDTTDQVPPPHYRRPPPPHYRRPPPPHYRRAPTPRRHVVHHHYVAPAPALAPAAVRPRQSIVDPRSSVYFGIGALANMVVKGDAHLTQVIRTGGGFNLFFGFRFSEYVALELGGMFSFHGTDDPLFESGMLNAFTGDIKVFVMPSSRRIEPFVQLGIGGYLFSRNGWEGTELAGAGLQLGGGVDIRLNRVIALGGRLLYRGVYLDNSSAAYWTGERYESAFMNLFTADLNLQVHF